MSFGQFAPYRARVILAGDLADAWADCGGLAGKVCQRAIVLEMSITDHDRVAIAYDNRTHREIKKIALMRPSNTDYLELHIDVNTDIRTGIIRDFEIQADAVKLERGRDRIHND